MTATLQQTLSPLFGHGRPNVRPDEAATALGITARQVAELELEGWLQGFGIGDAPERKREHLRISRASVEGFFAFRLEQRGQPVLFDLSPEAARWRSHLSKTSDIRPQTSDPKLETQNPKLQAA